MIRLAPALLPLLLAAGCVPEARSRQLASGEPAPPAPVRANQPVRTAPGTEETARRVLAVSQKVVAANPQVGVRPLFATVGAPHAEIFHRGGPLDGMQIFVSEGLVRRCKSDAELAALLCLELGKIVSEREAQAGEQARQGEKRLPPSEAIGGDSGGTFGPPDGTRRMELAKLEQARRSRARILPDPEALARKYLINAGFDAAVLADVAPLAREADGHAEVERGFGGGKAG
jgi:predicted Zn-dependent protease